MYDVGRPCRSDLSTARVAVQQGHGILNVRGSLTGLRLKVRVTNRTRWIDSEPPLC